MIEGVEDLNKFTKGIRHFSTFFDVTQKQKLISILCDSSGIDILLPIKSINMGCRWHPFLEAFDSVINNRKLNKPEGFECL